MRDITAEMRTLDYQRALRQHAQLLKGLSEVYQERAERTIPAADAARLEGLADGLLLASEALAAASEWDSP